VFDDDEELSPAERRAENLAPKTRDLAAEITPDVATDDNDGDSGMLSQRDQVENITADSETATAFWAAVVYLNVGLLLVAVGPMLLIFRGRTQVGPLLLVVGVFALYRAYSVYRGYTAPNEEKDETDAQEEVDGEELEADAEVAETGASNAIDATEPTDSEQAPTED
jgi:hypothetical protein